MVTGGCGMIGSNLVKRLVREGWDVYVADNLWRGKIEYLNDEEGKPVIDLDTRLASVLKYAGILYIDKNHIGVRPHKAETV